MEKVEAASRSLLRVAWLGAAGAVAAIALLWAYAEREGRAAARQAVRAEVQGETALLAAGLQGAVDRNVQLVQGLVAVISFEPEMADGRFMRLAGQVLSAASEIRHIAAAPDLVIRRVYPLRDNYTVIGIDYRDLPDQLPEIELARDLGVAVLVGPVDLIQGGRGFIVRSPVFVDDGSGIRAAVLGDHLDGDRPRPALCRGGPRRAGPRDFGGGHGEGRGVGTRAVLRRSVDPRAGPGDGDGDAAARDMGDRGGSERRLGAAARALGASRAVRAGRDRRWCCRSSERRGPPSRASAGSR